MAEKLETPINVKKLDTDIYLNDLLPALQRLDHLLEQAITAARMTYGPEAATDPFRGMHISRDDVEDLLTRVPGAPTLQTTKVTEEDSALYFADKTMGLSRITAIYHLSPFELDVLLITLAPELDLRYERLYGYLQDDVTRKRPTVDLTLNLLCSSAEDRLARRVHFGPDASLIRHDLLYLVADPNHIAPPLLAHYLKLDEQIVCLILGQDTLDHRLSRFCEVINPSAQLDEAAIPDDIKRALKGIVVEAGQTHRSLKLYFQGPRGTEKRRVAEALASEAGTRLLVVELACVLAANIDVERTLRLIFREAQFKKAILYIDDLDALLGNKEASVYQSLRGLLREVDGICIMAGTQPWTPLPPCQRYSGGSVITVPFTVPDSTRRRNCWQAALAATAITVDPESLDSLADRFRLTPIQIAEAAVIAQDIARWRVAVYGQIKNVDDVSLADLFAAARQQSGHDLATLARKIESCYAWSDIVLPADTLVQLREICDQARFKSVIYEKWGFGRRMSLGKDLTALFSGSSGTGKTMAADIIAAELGLDLYKIDLSEIVSKYIGETEKNLDRVFTVAENANVILFFDEADSLFGKRSKVRDAHDRYANIEVSYLLQKMEEYDGITILATNMQTNMDDAFVRRIKFHVEFPFPEEHFRYRIWQQHFTPEAPRDQDIDFEFLARQFKLTGGHIRNIIINAAFLAAADDRVIRMSHLILATKREYQKLGKTCSETEFGLYYPLVRD